jgi:hypothetical protein
LSDESTAIARPKSSPTPPNFATDIWGVVGDQAKLFVATKPNARHEAKTTRRIF